MIFKFKMKSSINLSYDIKLKNKKFNKNEYYHYFTEPDNSLIIPILKNKFLLVVQKRIPINKLNYEFPMGWIDKGESRLKACQRELLEETGYKSEVKPKKLVEFYADPGRGSRSCYCFYSRNIKKIKQPEKNINIFFKTKQEIFRLIKTKKFNNSAHIAAFLFLINKN